MRPVFNPHEVVLEGSHNLLTKGVLYVPKGVERERGRVVSVADERYFGSGVACWEHRRHSRIERGGYLFCQEVCVDDG